MSQDNTNAAQAVAAVEVTSMLFTAFSASLERLNPRVLSEDAIKNLNKLAGEMGEQIAELQRSTYKLLD